MAKKKIKEPTTLDESNKLEVGHVIGFYRSQQISYDVLKTWAVEAGKKLNILNCELIKDLPDGWFIDTWGYVGRLYNNGLINSTSNINLLREALIKLVDKSVQLKNETKNKVSPMEIVKSQVDDFLESIESELSDDFDIVGAIQKTTLTNTHIRQVANKINNQTLKGKLDDYLEENKKTRKKKSKVKSKEDICKLFKCLDEYEGIKGYKPEDIINSECVVVYHTKKNTITFYYGNPNLSVNRSSIINFDEDKSFEYKLADKDHLKIGGKIRVNNVFKQNYENEKKGKKATGRVNDSMILIGKY